MSKDCTRCGKCCTNLDYMTTLSATAEDVDRWTREHRWDILQWCNVFPSGAADLWLNQDTGEEVERCPFVRKDRNQPTYRCAIYHTRPQVCRDYVPWSEHSICEQLGDA